MSSRTELAWFSCGYSGSSGDDCVEVAACPTTVHVRDSKRPHGPRLALSPAVWHSFLLLAAREG